MTEAQSNPLQTILDEFKTLSPETTNALIFKDDGQTLAITGATGEDQAKRLILNFASISQQAGAIGGIENLTIQAADSQLNITATNSLYLVTVSSRAANQEIVKSLTQVVVPTVIRLIDQVGSQPTETPPSQAATVEEKPGIDAALPTVDEPSVEPIPEPRTPIEPFLPATPVNQFMVEKIGGLLVAADTVRIDGEILANWSEHFGGKQITSVNIEALDGKKTACKVKPIKETKTSAKGIIQVPEKILQALQTEKGKLVMVKPIVD